jgi:threonine aldolase
MLQDGAWLRHAAHANAMARRLHDRLRPLSEVRILFPTQANAVFAEFPPHVVLALRRIGWKFYTFIGQGGCRLMCAWDTRPEDVDQFAADVEHCLASAPRDVPLQRIDSRKL